MPSIGTAAITAGTYLTGNAAAGTFKTVRIEVTVSSSAGGNATNTVVLTATSNSEPSQVDVVRAITSR